MNFKKYGFIISVILAGDTISSTVCCNCSLYHELYKESQLTITCVYDYTYLANQKRLYNAFKNIVHAVCCLSVCSSGISSNK